MSYTGHVPTACVLPTVASVFQLYRQDPLECYSEHAHYVLSPCGWCIIPSSCYRVRIEDEDSVINYKVCRWSSLKIEGWSTADNNATSHNQLRLIAGASKIFISFKRSISDSSIMYFRVVVSLGELMSQVCKFEK